MSWHHENGRLKSVSTRSAITRKDTKICQKHVYKLKHCLHDTKTTFHSLTHRDEYQAMNTLTLSCSMVRLSSNKNIHNTWHNYMNTIKVKYISSRLSLEATRRDLKAKSTSTKQIFKFLLYKNEGARCCCTVLGSGGIHKSCCCTLVALLCVNYTVWCACVVALMLLCVVCTHQVTL